MRPHLEVCVCVFKVERSSEVCTRKRGVGVNQLRDGVGDGICWDTLGQIVGLMGRAVLILRKLWLPPDTTHL